MVLPGERLYNWATSQELSGLLYNLKSSISPFKKPVICPDTNLAPNLDVFGSCAKLHKLSTCEFDINEPPCALQDRLT